MTTNKRRQYTGTYLSKVDSDRVKGRGGDAIWSIGGCEKFESSGPPAHPEVKKKLIKQNLKTVTIPEDINVTETS